MLDLFLVSLLPTSEKLSLEFCPAVPSLLYTFSPHHLIQIHAVNNPHIVPSPPVLPSTRFPESKCMEGITEPCLPRALSAYKPPCLTSPTKELYLPSLAHLPAPPSIYLVVQTRKLRSSCGSSLSSAPYLPLATEFCGSYLYVSFIHIPPSFSYCPGPVDQRRVSDYVRITYNFCRDRFPPHLFPWILMQRFWAGA